VNLPREKRLEIALTYIYGIGQSTAQKICALLTKPSRREIDIHCRYTGFEIPNRFVIGYGLDFAERYRNLPFVGVLRDELAAQAEEIA